MMTPTPRRRGSSNSGRRLAVGAATLVLLGGAAVVTQSALAAGSDGSSPAANGACPTPAASASADPSSASPTDSPTADPSAAADPAAAAPAAADPAACASASAGSPAATPAASVSASPSASVNSDLGLILGSTCDGSQLAPHTGFQDAPRCVKTEFGEVTTADKNPSLLITDSPNAVRVNQAFDIKVSTRNLVRDRFLKAAKGGYYLESAFLTADGLTRGHFHTACRMLTSLTDAPDPAPVPTFFLATEDGGGGAQPDTVTIHVTGMPSAGMAQCAVWAGDGSHRIPMMQRANQTPAFDAVRINVLDARHWRFRRH